MNVAEFFLENFHNLSGETIKEKQNNFYKLLNDNRTLLKRQNVVETLQYSLQPKNHFEKILRTDFLIHFRCFNALYEDFKAGDEITVKKLARQEWFFNEAYQQIDCDNFVNVILPQTSYSLKLKILKKIPLQEEKANELFDTIEAKYGVYLASNLITKCSIKKIGDILRKYPIKLTVSQMKKIFDKNPDLLEIYFEEREKIEDRKDFLNHNPILIYIAQRNPQKFAKLFKKYKFQTYLGRRTTKQFLKTEKSTVVNKRERYLTILNKQAVVRKIGPQLKEVFFETKPGCSKKIWLDIIDFYPKKYRFEIYRTIYNEVFHKKFGDDVMKLSEKEFELIEDLDLREKLATLKRQKEPNDALMKYLKPETCLNEVLSKISSTLFEQRCQFITYLVENCLLNKNYNVLLKTCELVAVRLKNDDFAIRILFVNTLIKRWQILKHFEDTHWKYINEILATAELDNHRIFHKDKVYYYYLIFLIKNGRDIIDFLKMGRENDANILQHINRVQHRKEFKEILTTMLKLGYTKIDTDNKTKAAQFDMGLVYYCKIFNKENPSDSIDFSTNPRILKSAQILLQKDEYYPNYEAQKGLIYFLCQKSTEPQLLELKSLYFKKLEKCANISALVWFLKHEPQVLEKNLENVLNVFKKLKRKTFWKLVQKCSFMGLDRKVVQFYRQKVQENASYKTCIIKPLAILSEPNWLLEFSKDYIPQTEKVDLSDRTTKELYEFQSDLIKYLHLVNNSREDILETTFNFCKGDFLKFALGPLYSCIYRLPERETKSYLERLNQIPNISVRKHYVHLSLVTSDSETIRICLKTSNCPILLATIRYFIKAPSDELWQIIEQRINALKKNDLQILKYSLNFKLPSAYKAKYIETIWSVLQKHEDKQLKEKILSKITKVNFELEFAKDFIKSNIFKYEEANKAVCNILLNLEFDDKYHLLDEVFQSWKKTSWNCLENRRKNRTYFHRFFVALWEIYIKLESPPDEFPLKLLQILRNNFSHSEIFQELIIVNSFLVKKNNPETYGQLLHLITSLINEFGDFCVHLLTETLRIVFQQIFKTDNKKLELLHHLLKLNRNRSVCLLVLKLLPKAEPREKKYFALYKEILDEMENNEDKLLELQMNYYLKN